LFLPEADDVSAKGARKQQLGAHQRLLILNEVADEAEALLQRAKHRSKQSLSAGCHAKAHNRALHEMTIRCTICLHCDCGRRHSLIAEA